MLSCMCGVLFSVHVSVYCVPMFENEELVQREFENRTTEQQREPQSKMTSALI